MPTVFQDGAYDFIFFSSDGGEPAHIHVKRDLQIAKFWLEPVSLAKNRGFKEQELNQVARLVVKHRERLSGESQKSLDRWLASHNPNDI